MLCSGNKLDTYLIFIQYSPFGGLKTWIYSLYSENVHGQCIFFHNLKACAYIALFLNRMDSSQKTSSGMLIE